ncbi:sensor histidine kinase [Pedobacter chinensis]|uniref:histidine kinase n=1 Tax=Pedobacter chinensis TaxID=2282421 RepID=A0A369Q0K0_9SPHI|nr:HAMP domain-containing sensor histidine kinase [Pedobacter chinensis]RDC56985.1 sensor histidine kinase [Pedobacter chinensis]
MRKSANLLVVICFSVMALLLLLQVYWIINYYNSALKDFEKEVNLAFEDGIKKELSLRCDTIQHIIENKLLDTTAFTISARFDKKDQKYVYTVSANGNAKDKFSSSFSLADYSKALPKDKRDTSVRKQVASRLALLMREEDLEQHIIYYRTQKLGLFMDEQTKKYQFDTARLRPAFNIYLKERKIKVPYSFIVKKEDSTNNKGIAASARTKTYPIVTKAFSTYRYTDNQRYVRAMFKSPTSYILSRMGLMLFSSLAMIVIVSGCMFVILKSLFREKRLSAIKNDFISNITHEFKTPISTVSIAIEALSSDEVNQNEDKRKRYLTHAKNEIERLNLLVDQVLKMAIYHEGKSTLTKEKIAIDSMIKQLINIHKIASGKDISVEYLNKSGTDCLLADETQFQHAINNILDNAIKYSRDQPEIKINILRNHNDLIISIEDNGIGISEKEIPAVFDKFYRVSTGNRHLVKGYGLGLNYVKQIMQQHNGWYKIESKLAQGTTVILGWPI